MVKTVEPNKLKLWILGAVLEGHETSKDIHDYVWSCGYYGTDKAVTMDLKRYANHGMIQRKRLMGNITTGPLRPRRTLITISKNGKTS